MRYRFEPVGGLPRSNTLGNFTGNVTCLDVVGNQAITGGVITGGGEPGEVGTGYAVGFIDDAGTADDTR